MITSQQRATLMACVLVAMFVSISACAGAMTPVLPDTQKLLDQWAPIISDPDVEDKAYQTEEKMIVSPTDAVGIAIETIKELEKIPTDELAEYIPSVDIYYVSPKDSPNFRSGYWEITFTPPEGQENLRTYFVEISAEDPNMVKYVFLNAEGEEIKVLRQDLDGRWGEVVEGLPGSDPTGELSANDIYVEPKDGLPGYYIHVDD